MAKLKVLELTEEYEGLKALELDRQDLMREENTIIVLLL